MKEWRTLLARILSPPTAVSDNEKADVAGYFSIQSGNIQSFETQPGEWVTTYVPGATATQVTAFAQDQLHGFEIPAGNFVTNQQHGFYGTSTTPIDPPGSVNTSLTYFNNGIQPNYEYGGYAQSANGTTFGWVRRTAKFTKYRYPGAVNTKVTGSLGEEVFGQFIDTDGKTHGFQFQNGPYYEVLSQYAEVTLTGVAEDGSFTGFFLGEDGHYQGYLATCDAGPDNCVAGSPEVKPATAEPLEAN